MNGAVAAGHEVTAQAGARALEQGGNAVDAAVAAGVMSWASEAALTGPCGGGFMLIYRARDRRTMLLDAFTAVPGLNRPTERDVVEPESVEVPFDERTCQVFHIGPGSCAVPGVAAGLYAAHRRLGRLPWRELLAPAAEAASAGVRLTRQQDEVTKAIGAVVTHTPESAAVFAPAGRLLREGEIVRQEDLAGSIERLAELGAGDLYTGGLGRKIAEHQAATGGPLTFDDLAAYRPIWRRPIHTSYHGHEIVTNAPPSSGGLLIAYMLAVLDGLEERLTPGAARSMRILAETMRAAARLRDRDFERRLWAGGLAGRVLSAEPVERGRDAVRRALDGAPSLAPALASDRGTTHISVVDRDGNAVAFTASNGCHSGVVVPNTGLQLNNMMGEEDLAAGRDRPPGERLTSMQAPSMAFCDEDLRLVVGSSGSNRLRSAILQVVANVIDANMRASEAVRFPRVHVEGERLDTEGGFDPAELDALAAWGERLNRFESLNLYFGGTNVITRDDAGLDAAGDPRRGGHGIVLTSRFDA